MLQKYYKSREKFTPCKVLAYPQLLFLGICLLSIKAYWVAFFDTIVAARRFEHKISDTRVRRFEHRTSDTRVTALNYLQILFALNFSNFVGIADVVTSQFQLKEPHVELLMSKVSSSCEVFQSS